MRRETDDWDDPCRPPFPSVVSASLVSEGKEASMGWQTVSLSMRTSYRRTADHSSVSDQIIKLVAMGNLQL